MIENENELIEFFDAQYSEDVTADDIKKGIKDDLKSYAEEHNVSPKSIMQAYNLYKKYKCGKYKADECDEISALSSIVENYFANGNE